MKAFTRCRLFQAYRRQRVAAVHRHVYIFNQAAHDLKAIEYTKEWTSLLEGRFKRLVTPEDTWE